MTFVVHRLQDENMMAGGAMLRLVSSDGTREVSSRVEAVSEAAGADAWVGLLWPGETDEKGVLPAALRLAATQPDDVAALSVKRFELSPTGLRVRDVLRVFRPGRLAGLDSDSDGDAPVKGQVAVLGGDALTLDRASVGGATAIAVAAEARGDWLSAADAWAIGADGPEPMGAWCRFREGLALAQVAPGSPRARDAFAQALARFPALPEAAMGLAAGAVRAPHRRADALRFIRFAESLGEPVFLVPQPEGAGSWYVPAAACRLLSPVDPALARRFYEEAERRGCPATTLSAISAGITRANHDPGSTWKGDHHG